MNLIKKKTESLRYVKNAAISEDYALFCTGKKVIVCDHRLQPVRVFEPLRQVYSACISPDQTKALFVSEKSLFYIADLIDGSVACSRFLPPYNDDVDGVGCWDRGGASVIIPAQNKNTMCSVVRRYPVGELNTYEDVFSGNYRITYVAYVESAQKLLFVGSDLDKYFHFEAERWFMAWHDGGKTDIIYLRGNDTGVEKTAVNEKEQIITVFSNNKVSEYGFDGRLLSQSSLADHYAEKGKSFHPLFINETVYKTVPVGANGDCLVGTSKAIALVNTKQNTVTKRIPEAFGVYDIRVLENNIVLYATGSGVKAAELTDQKNGGLET